MNQPNFDLAPRASDRDEGESLTITGAAFLFCGAFWGLLCAIVAVKADSLAALYISLAVVFACVAGGLVLALRGKP